MKKSILVITAVAAIMASSVSVVCAGLLLANEYIGDQYEMPGNLEPVTDSLSVNDLPIVNFKVADNQLAAGQMFVFRNELLLDGALVLLGADASGTGAVVFLQAKTLRSRRLTGDQMLVFNNAVFWEPLATG
ncbi:MAG: hypothetical protein COA54_02495 [Thiotrichaceae bacterium]|nr:MAG: hypothetical protein COA54_02495 [Thiotrichaceae bacterium]